ncbi:DNA repair protein [Alteracholeplasma palmae J233]|uniref:DNA repair protein n=1 Tax=Alteracholeplasma palmae (strain ATCC 49389 / J233) TaxID=1318466 RepID=U4KKC7_ALTPJ|nr:DNA repair protein RecO [Alteracholeplasma palmae]CCV64164.1 DNA repair protein [Alteracholeplasma palmae J233]
MDTKTNKIKGIIYKVLPYKESAKMVFVYTEKGKYTLIFQGAQKTNNLNRAITQYLSLIEFELNPMGKRMMNISQAKLLDSYDKLKDSYDTTKKYATILELLDKVVTDEDEHETIFKIALEALSDTKIGYLRFLARLLPVIGYHFNLKPDGRKIKGYSLLLNRLIYKEETESIILDVVATTELLKLFINKQTDAFTQEDQLSSFLIKYYDYYLQYQFKTMK